MKIVLSSLAVQTILMIANIIAYEPECMNLTLDWWPVTPGKECHGYVVIAPPSESSPGERAEFVHFMLSEYTG